jgi:NCS1 family nucleobase:cation symporter-1
MPWKLIADPNGYIFTWLIAYSSLLGPIGGIMITEYYFIRKKELVVKDLYSLSGIYTYKKGFNHIAIIAMLLGILPNVPGFFITIHVLPKDALPEWIGHLYNYAWFVGFFVSAVSYLLLSSGIKSTNQEKA